LAKRDRLPPGLERQLVVNGTLPPGLEKDQPPPRVEAMFPPPRTMPTSSLAATLC
jgi:hypothetical protein